MKELPRKTRMAVGRVLGLLIVAGAATTGYWVWRLNLKEPRTNDAMVYANIVDVVLERVNGRITDLYVFDNQGVKKGDLLFKIDDRPFQAAADQARAELQLAEKEVEGNIADIRGAEANIHQSEHDLRAADAEITRLEAEAAYARSYLQRIEPLLEKQFVTANAVSQAVADRKSAEASVRDAQAKQRAARAAVVSAHQARAKAEAALAQFGDAYARIEAARAELETALLNLDYCKIEAPFDGYVTNMNIAVGQYIQPEQKVFALVDDRTWYVVANYKETYLRSIKPGMAVDVFLATYPGKHFRGEVQGIGWANAPDNVKAEGALAQPGRTLNWVVLAARFPVRIKLLDRDPEYPFRMGMTAYTRVLGFPLESRHGAR